MVILPILGKNFNISFSNNLVTFFFLLFFSREHLSLSLAMSNWNHYYMWRMLSHNTEPTFHNWNWYSTKMVLQCEPLFLIKWLLCQFYWPPHRFCELVSEVHAPSSDLHWIMPLYGPLPWSLGRTYNLLLINGRWWKWWLLLPWLDYVIHQSCCHTTPMCHIRLSYHPGARTSPCWLWKLSSHML